MSEPNEKVSEPAANIGGGGSTPPPISTSTTTANIIAPSSSTSGSSMLNGFSSSLTRLPPTCTADTVPISSPESDDVVRCGYLKKVKGKKKKFFVLRKETSIDKPARLEYYDKEKNFRSGQPTKKSIDLKACFNISRIDSKCKYSIALHTRNDCVRIAMKNEEEMKDWLKVMNSLAGSEEDEEDDFDLPQSTGKFTFEHIWFVTAINKGLGSTNNIIGPYRLCLTPKEVTLLKVGGHDGRKEKLEFSLPVIRNISHSATVGGYFTMELGRLAPTGSGLLWLKADDNNIAQNMHVLILKAMQNSRKGRVCGDRESRRDLTYAWNSDRTLGPRSSSFHSSSPPGLTRMINPIDGSMEGCRGRVDSISSSFPSKGLWMSTTPSFTLSRPHSSTGTNSASSSYSIDYDNHHIHHQKGSMFGSENAYSESQDEDEYVPWSPADKQQTSVNSLNQDATPNVEISLASKDDSGYMEMQSPMPLFDDYVPMNPPDWSSPNLQNCTGGKLTGSHSRNLTPIEEYGSFIPINPTAHNMRYEAMSCGNSTAGSTKGLDKDYLDMDLGKSLNLHNDVRQRSASSSESTGLPYFPLEKVSCYLTGNMDDDRNSMRPVRAYSEGSTSNASSSARRIRTEKGWLGAVRKTFRIRSMSAGSKGKLPLVTQNSDPVASPRSELCPASALPNSCSDSTG